MRADKIFESLVGEMIITLGAMEKPPSMDDLIEIMTRIAPEFSDKDVRDVVWQLINLGEITLDWNRKLIRRSENVG